MKPDICHCNIYLGNIDRGHALYCFLDCHLDIAAYSGNIGTFQQDNIDVDHSDVIMYTEGEEATLPKCCIMMEKMGRYCHYLIHFDGQFYDSNLGILNEYDTSKLLGYLEVKVN